LPFHSHQIFIENMLKYQHDALFDFSFCRVFRGRYPDPIHKGNAGSFSGQRIEHRDNPFPMAGRHGYWQLRGGAPKRAKLQNRPV
jgi:hypothetical protein